MQSVARARNREEEDDAEIAEKAEKVECDFGRNVDKRNLRKLASQARHKNVSPILKFASRIVVAKRQGFFDGFFQEKAEETEKKYFC